MRNTALLIGLFLAPIVAANLLTTEFAEHGHPEYSVLTAFGLVALTFVARDRLHDAWRENRVLKMGALIAAGAALAYLVNPAAERIALASCAAFAVSETIDALAYHANRWQPWLIRSNKSNIAGSVADSFVFVLIAFPGFLWLLAATQAMAKIAGGVLFSYLLARRRERALVGA